MLHTTVDGLLGYPGVVADYDARYERKEYYWGLTPNRLCFEIMKLLPPVRPYRVLELGCGKGKDAVFLAKCGYAVTAFDLSEKGLAKVEKLAEQNGTEVTFFKADLMDYRPDQEFDIIFSSGVLHYVPETLREKLCDSLKEHTAPGGLNVLNVIVKKPFIERAPDASQEETLRHPWLSGEIFTRYHDWLFEQCREEIFDCNSGGVPHQNCMDTLIARKV